jgi:hypothetical protein
MSKNEPSDTLLYQKVKSEAKQRFDVWPSAYASGWLVKEYKRQFSKKHGSRKSPYRKKKKSRTSRKSSSSDLDRWFKEDWRNVCETDSRGRYKKCGRRKSSGSYPYCRPRKRISSKTPTTIGELSKSELKQMCRKKRSAEKKRDRRKKSPSRVYLSSSKGATAQKSKRSSRKRSRRSRKGHSKRSRKRRSVSSPPDWLRKCVGRKIPIFIREGYPQKQAIAIAYSMCRRHRRESKK